MKILVRIGLVTVASLGLLASGAYAGATNETIQAFLNHTITVKVNNKTVNMTDSDGKPVDPISYNGSTYFPIRAISNALGASVKWDQATSTILINQQGANVPAIAVSDDQVINYLKSKVTEIAIEGQLLATKNTKLTMYVEGKKAYRDEDNALYFSVYVGESHPDHNVRWQTFLVKEDLTDIYVQDYLTGSYKPLKDWQAEMNDPN